MLNNAQRNSLRILMSLIEGKMRAKEFRLAHPDEQALMFEVHNDLSPDTPPALQEKVAEVSGLIQILRDLQERIDAESQIPLQGPIQLSPY